MTKQATLVMIVSDGKVLLGMKKRGFGVGRWNGFGGKVEEGESFPDAAKREVFEESGLIVERLDEVGLSRFEFEDGTSPREVHIFRCDRYAGDPVESDEMRPEWFDVSDLPLSEMWPADTHGLPLFLEGKRFRAEFMYDCPSTSDRASKILHMTVEELPKETEGREWRSR